jgi:hypothetical protein
MSKVMGQQKTLVLGLPILDVTFECNPHREAYNIL